MSSLLSVNTGLNSQTSSLFSFHSNPPVDTILPLGSKVMASRSGSDAGGDGSGGTAGVWVTAVTTFTACGGGPFFDSVFGGGDLSVGVSFFESMGGGAVESFVLCFLAWRGL
jgi:hypothetical protein